MIRMGTPADVDSYYYTDDPDIILRLHQSGQHPAWRDSDCTYFKKTKKLLRLLEKWGIN